MAFDGITVSALVAEFDNKLTGGHIQKIAQPESDEILLSIKNNRESYKLHISANASLPLINLTQKNKVSPMVAPNFCMLLRKHINNAKILGFTQVEFERVIRIDLEHYNELGDLVHPSLMIEIMGKHSNIIFVNENNIIIDSIKHINGLVSSVREVLPGREYFIPNTQNKINPLTVTKEQLLDIITSKPLSAAKAISSTFTGFSNVMAYELCNQANIDGDASLSSLNGNNRSDLIQAFLQVVDGIKSNNYAPSIYKKGAMPVEFCAFNMTMYEDLLKEQNDSISFIVEDFYEQKEVVNRIRQKSIDLRKAVTNLLERAYKKKDLLLKQLKSTEKMDKYKVYGELINTYGYQLDKSDDKLTCINFYDNCEITIPIDNSLSVSENANHYFNRYNKLKRTKDAVIEQQKENNETIEYLESVMNSIEIARKEEDLALLRRELSDQRYLKPEATKGKKKQKQQQKSSPLHFISSDGFDIYVGKNNYQNDDLTFNFANGNDWWFHAKQMPGSHVILKSNGEEPTDLAFEEAASLAAYFSKGKEAEKIEIDYTLKKNVKKPNGGKPGFVVYYTNYSMVAKPQITNVKCANKEDEIFIERSFLV